MAIEISDLSDAAAEQVLQKYRQLMGREAEAGKTRGKYGNVKDTRGGVKFDSQKEARRYDELMLLLRAGDIFELRLQPQFTLQEAFTTPDGERIGAVRYIADFSYRDQSGALVVEDVKSRGTRTQVYINKRKQMQDRFGISVREA